MEYGEAPNLPELDNPQSRRGDLFVESAMEMNSSSGRSGIGRPDGAGESGGADGYKNFGPDGAFGRRDCVRKTSRSGWIGGGCCFLRRVFANVLRLIPLYGTQPRSGRELEETVSWAALNAGGLPPGWWI